MSAFAPAMPQRYRGYAVGFRAESAGIKILALLLWAQSRPSLGAVPMTAMRDKAPIRRTCPNDGFWKIQCLRDDTPNVLLVSDNYINGVSFYYSLTVKWLGAHLKQDSFSLIM
jgi:hypothetical protein